MGCGKVHTWSIHVGLCVYWSTRLPLTVYLRNVDDWCRARPSLRSGVRHGWCRWPGPRPPSTSNSPSSCRYISRLSTMDIDSIASFTF